VTTAPPPIIWDLKCIHIYVAHEPNFNDLRVRFVVDKSAGVNTPLL